MALKCMSKYTLMLILASSIPTISIQLQQGEEIVGNNIHGASLKECLSVEGRSRDLGVCFGNELLNNLHRYDEQDAFSLTTGVSFVRDEKTPRDFSSFLDKDPMDFRSIMESASNLISKRSLHWDLSSLYPGLVMRVGPTLANGMLEFVMDPRIKDRTFQGSEELSTGRLLAKNLLVPFLLGFKFQLSTLLPIVLGLLLIASKKAFLLAKLAILAVTLFGGGSSFGGLGSVGGLGGFGGYGGPSLSSFNSPYTTGPGYYGGQHNHGSIHCNACGDNNPFVPGYFNRNPHQADYYYKEKSSEPSTASPITPGELRDRLERLFITKNEMNQPHEDQVKIRDSRSFAWSQVI